MKSSSFLLSKYLNLYLTLTKEQEYQSQLKNPRFQTLWPDLVIVWLIPGNAAIYFSRPVHNALAAWVTRMKTPEARSTHKKELSHNFLLIAI